MQQPKRVANATLSSAPPLPTEVSGPSTAPMIVSTAPQTSRKASSPRSAQMTDFFRIAAASYLVQTAGGVIQSGNGSWMIPDGKEVTILGEWPEET